MFCPQCKAEYREGFLECANCHIPLVSELPPKPPTIEYAGFWIRFGANWIDIFLVSISGAVASSILSLPLDPATSNLELFSEYVTFMLSWVYWAGMESSERQATLGKRVLGVVVTDLQGNRISFGKASGRFFGKIPSALMFGIGFVMAGLTERKQALHDIFAGCLVVTKESLKLRPFQLPKRVTVTTVFETENPAEIMVAKSLLDDAQIPYFELLNSQNLIPGVASFPSYMQVPEEYEDEARELLGQLGESEYTDEFSQS